MDSIGGLLKQERERRELSLQDVHESTRITVQNLSALEDDRFDSFPNKVYARAFIRDYGNFLGLDSAELLTRYEAEWGSAREPIVAPKTSSRSIWKTLGYSIAAIIIIAGIGVGAYFGLEVSQKRGKAPAEERRVRSDSDSGKVATFPNVNVPAEKAVVETKAAEPKTPVVPDKVIVEVAAIDNVWVDVKPEGSTRYMGMLPKGQVKSFESVKQVYVRVGRPAAAQVKVNGVVKSMGDPSKASTKIFKLQDIISAAKAAGAVPSAPAPKPANGSNPAPQPAQGTNR